MKFETLVAAYSVISRRKYITRAKLASLCSFTVMTAGNAARELKSLGLVKERIFPKVGKLSSLPLCLSMLTVQDDTLTLISFNEGFRICRSHSRRRNYSFHLVDDVSTLLTDFYKPDPVFPFLFCQGIPVLELKIFGDLLPDYINVPDDTPHLRKFIISCLVAKKIEQKALAKEEEM